MFFQILCREIMVHSEVTPFEVAKLQLLVSGEFSTSFANFRPEADADIDDYLDASEIWSQFGNRFYLTLISNCNFVIFQITRGV